MNTILKIAVTSTVLVLMLIVDIPILPVQLVPDAEAILGVRRRTRRRTAVVAYSAGAAAAGTAAMATTAAATDAAMTSANYAQQQAAAAQQQAAAAQQQAAAAQPASGVPIGTVASTLPAGCKTFTVSGTDYHDCNGSFYKAAFQGNNLVYVTVANPL